MTDPSLQEPANRCRGTAPCGWCAGPIERTGPPPRLSELASAEAGRDVSPAARVEGRGAYSLP
jgi:hypothetical protein